MFILHYIHFFQQPKLQKTGSIRIIDAIIDIKTIPTVTGLNIRMVNFLKNSFMTKIGFLEKCVADNL